MDAKRTIDDVITQIVNQDDADCSVEFRAIIDNIQYDIFCRDGKWHWDCVHEGDSLGENAAKSLPDCLRQIAHDIEKRSA